MITSAEIRTEVIDIIIFALFLYHCHSFHTHTAQKRKFPIKDFFSKCDQIRRKLRIWSHLLKKSLMGNFIFCAMPVLLSF